jgi:hypothetical protein
MHTKDPEKSMLEKVSGLLNEGVENLDSRTGRRLEHIRSEALRAAEKPSRFFIPERWIVVGGLATALMAAGALFFWLPTSPGDFPVRNIEDLEIITSQERIDFYENLEFYRWLATQKNENLKNGRVSWDLTAPRQGNTGRG